MGNNLGDGRSVQRCRVMSPGQAPKRSTSVQEEKSQSCV